MAQVRLEHVCKIYPGNVRAVKDFNLTIENGEFMVMVGPSGCGKSTTLRMVAGLEEISEGKVYIGDRLVNDVLPKDRDIAMVFQNYALYPDKTVYENMAFCLKMRKFKNPNSRPGGFLDNLFSWWNNRKLKRAEIDRRVKEASEILGITEFLDRRPKALSGGQRQRVAVGRCIVRNPSVFLFDEPLSNLDAKMRVQMRTEISRLHNKLKTTMIYVTHDQTEAMTMGDRIVVMKDGYIQQVATPSDLYDNPNNTFVAGFIGTPPMNFFNAVLVKENGHFAVKYEDNFTLPTPAEWADKIGKYENKKITFGIRPEHIGSTAAETMEDAPRISAAVEVIEPMGSETYLYLKTGQTGFIARIDPHRKCEVGETVHLATIMRNAHIFDPETTERIV